MSSSCSARNMSVLKMKEGWSLQQLDSSPELPYPQACHQVMDPVTKTNMYHCQTATDKPYQAFFVNQDYQKMYCKTDTSGGTACYQTMDQCQK